MKLRMLALIIMLLTLAAEAAAQTTTRCQSYNGAVTCTTTGSGGASCPGCGVRGR